ncbi:MAG: 50S ribosomal protein L9 [Eubacteriales bacterium]
MKVILRKEVKKLGKEGDLVEVADGYARNYLIPKGAASEATAENVRILNRRKKEEARLAEDKLEDAQEYAKNLEKVNVVIKIKAGENGKLFGSVNTKDIAEALEENHKIKIDKRKIDLEEPIKTTGKHVVDVKLHPEVKGQVKVTIEGEE